MSTKDVKHFAAFLDYIKSRDDITIEYKDIAKKLGVAESKIYRITSLSVKSVSTNLKNRIVTIFHDEYQEFTKDNPPETSELLSEYQEIIRKLSDQLVRALEKLEIAEEKIKELENRNR